MSANETRGGEAGQDGEPAAASGDPPLARRTRSAPSPFWGEGWGEGGRTLCVISLLLHYRSCTDPASILIRPKLSQVQAANFRKNCDGIGVGPLWRRTQAAGAGRQSVLATRKPISF